LYFLDKIDVLKNYKHSARFDEQTAKGT
jgi:hypothetical protein